MSDQTTETPKRGRGRPKKSNAGNYYEPHPLDFAIIEELPHEGMVLGLHNIAQTAAGVVNALNAKIEDERGHVNHNQVMARMRSMQVAGFVVKVKVLAKGGAGWQRTTKGETHYESQTNKKLSNKEDFITSILKEEH